MSAIHVGSSRQGCERAELVRGGDDILEKLGTCSVEALFTVGLVSRVCIALLMWFAWAVIGGESYDSSEFFYAGNVTPIAFLHHWDSVHFRYIATAGYTHDYTHAFFPGVPLVYQAVESIGLHPIAVNVLAALAFSTALVLLRALAANLLRSMLNVKQGEASVRPLGAVALLFLLTPCNVFTVAAYTESFFCAATFAGIFLSQRDNRERLPGLWFAGSWVCFACASILRSNGFLAAGFLELQGVVTFLRNPLLCVTKRKWWLLGSAVRGTASLLLLIPYAYSNRDGWNHYCRARAEGGEDRSFLPCGPNPYTSFYPMIQAQYWSCGWFQQWTVRNIPNFFIAIPTICIGLRILLRHVSTRELVTNVHLWHLVFFWILSLTMIHVQVVNRLTIACPAVYLLGALQLTREPRSFATATLLAYSLIYTFIGSVMFSNHLNWT